MEGGPEEVPRVVLQVVGGRIRPNESMRGAKPYFQHRLKLHRTTQSS